MADNLMRDQQRAPKPCIHGIDPLNCRKCQKARP